MKALFIKRLASACVGLPALAAVQVMGEAMIDLVGEMAAMIGMIGGSQ